MFSTEQTRTWPADEVHRHAVAALVPAARNARTHSEAQIDQLAASIREWGWTTPVLIDETSSIIAGHGRVLAAARLGIAEIPVMTARGWTDAQKRAYVLADNKLALNSGWDDALLAVELAELKAMTVDFGLMGFNADEVADLFAAPAAPKDTSKAGSLAARFGIPPFTVLSAREGWWQERKRAWLAIGIQSEVGRGENLLRMSDTMLQPDPKKRAAKAKAGKVAPHQAASAPAHQATAAPAAA